MCCRLSLPVVLPVPHVSVRLLSVAFGVRYHVCCVEWQMIATAALHLIMPDVIQITTQLLLSVD